MPRKALDVCRVSGCHRLTWNRKAQRIADLRYCDRHAPWGPSANLQPRASSRPPKGARVHPAFVPLACVFRSFASVQEGLALVGRICGAPAPRQLEGDRSLPRYASRHGDPLCPKHARYAGDPRAFPGEVPSSSQTSETSDEKRRRLMLERLARDADLLSNE